MDNQDKKSKLKKLREYLSNLSVEEIQSLAIDATLTMSELDACCAGLRNELERVLKDNEDLSNALSDSTSLNEVHSNALSALSSDNDSLNNLLSDFLSQNDTLTNTLDSCLDLIGKLFKTIEGYSDGSAVSLELLQKYAQLQEVSIRIGQEIQRSEHARNSVNKRHDKPGGSRDKRRKIREIYASGKYKSRDDCADKESEGLGMSFATARKALRNTPDPKKI